MAIRIVRLGSPRAAREGLRLGTVRRPPRGVRKDDYAKLNYYDLWLPDLAPSQKLVTRALKNWDGVPKAYRREMQAPAAERLLSLLAALSLPSFRAARSAHRTRCTRRLSRRRGWCAGRRWSRAARCSMWPAEPGAMPEFFQTWV